MDILLTGLRTLFRMPLELWRELLVLKSERSGSVAGSGMFYFVSGLIGQSAPSEHNTSGVSVESHCRHTHNGYSALYISCMASMIPCGFASLLAAVVPLPPVVYTNYWFRVSPIHIYSFFTIITQNHITGGSNYSQNRCIECIYIVIIMHRVRNCFGVRLRRQSLSAF
jgi:hypothetical protein